MNLLYWLYAMDDGDFDDDDDSNHEAHDSKR